MRPAGAADRRLRCWEPRDAAALAAAWNDPDIARWNPVPADRSIAAAEQWITAAHRRPSDSPFADRVMVDCDDGIVGEVGLRVDTRRSIGEVGFWIAADRRGRGEGHALLALASAWADELALRGLLAVTDSSNRPAIRLLTAAGWLEVRAVEGRRAFVDRQI